MATDYYSLLGVAKTASADEIKKAFRTKAHQFHPDKSTGDAEKFKEINEAYQVLSDPAKRQQYDQFGQTYDQARRQGGGPAGGGFGGFGQSGQWQNVNMDFGDLGDVFGDMFGFGGGRRSTPQRGQDVAAALRIDFRTAVQGGQEEFTIRHHVPCPHCSGRGAEPGSGTTTCSTCSGSGRVQRTQQTILGPIASVAACPDCDGEGQRIKEKCHQCRGTGKVEKTDTIVVKIPAGIDAGQRIKLAGKGEAGRRGTTPGDLYLEIDVASDPIFSRQDDDLLTTTDISISTAVLGGQVKVETLDGPVTLKIPAGTPSGKVFLIKGKGIPHLRGRGIGDLRVTVDVVIPKHPSARAKKLLQDLEHEGL